MKQINFFRSVWSRLHINRPPYNTTKWHDKWSYKVALRVLGRHIIYNHHALGYLGYKTGKYTVNEYILLTLIVNYIDSTEHDWVFNASITEDIVLR